MRNYLAKMRGNGSSPPCACYSDIAWSWVGAFLGILLVSALHAAVLDGTGRVLLIGSAGASAVLVYGAIESPLAQPRNLVGGHVLSALVGVLCARLLPEAGWLAAPLAVASAIALMHLTGTLHPPGGATALIAVIGGPQIRALGFGYVLVPAGASAVLLLVVALLVNNVPRGRSYPRFWW